MWTLGGLTALGLIIRAALGTAAYGTNDVDSWLAFAAAIDHGGPLSIYGVTRWPTVPVFDFNHGPLAAWALWLAPALQQSLGISGPLLVKVPAIAADAVSTVLVWTLVRRSSSTVSPAWAAALVALNPVLILISGFHGNTDPVFLMFALLAVLAARCDRPALAGVAFGIAMGIKVVPILLVPVLWLAFDRTRDRVRFLAGALGLSLVIWSPHLAADFGAVVGETLAYRSVPAAWGAGLVLRIDASHFVRQIIQEALVVVAIVLVVRSAKMLRSSEGYDPALSAAASFLVFLAVTPGFGVQYLAWPVLFLAASAPLVGTIYSLQAGLFLYVTYAHWAGSWWLDKANSWAASEPWNPAGEILKHSSWLVVLACAGWIHRRVVLDWLNQRKPGRSRGAIATESVEA